MKKITLLIISLAYMGVAMAQKQSFDLITYTAPKGWKKTVTETLISYSYFNETDKTWCQIGIVKSTISKGSIEQDFESEWKGLVIKNYHPTIAPQLNEVQVADGWKILTGAAKFNFNKGEAKALLTTMTGYDRCASIISSCNSEKYYKDIEALLSSVDLIKPATSTAPLAGNADDKNLIVSTWVATASDQSSLRVNNGVMNYIQRQYTFNANGTYNFYSKTFDPFMDKILLGKENGTYQISGNNITINPSKSVLEAWSKKDGADRWGRLLSSQNNKLEKITYQFTRHYFSGIKNWSLVLQADRPTQRDGSFSGGSAFSNAWLYGTPCAQCYINLPGQ